MRPPTIPAPPAPPMRSASRSTSARRSTAWPSASRWCRWRGSLDASSARRVRRRSARSWPCPTTRCGCPAAAGCGPGRSAPTGRFEVAGLAPGRYVLQAGRGRRPSNDLVGRTTVTVAGANLDNVSIALTTPADGHRAHRDRHRRTAGVPCRTGARLGGGRRSGADPLRRRWRGPGGRRLHLRRARHVGTVVLRGSSTPSGWYLKRILLDGQDVTDTPLGFDPGSVVAGLRVVLTQSAATVSGSVRDDRGAAVLDATRGGVPRRRGGVAAAVAIHPLRPARHLGPLRDQRASRLVQLPRRSPCRAWKRARPPTPSSWPRSAIARERLSLNDGEAKSLDLRLRP